MDTMQASRSQLWRGILQLADPKIWIASLVPFILGLSLASTRSPIPWITVWFAFLALICIEAGKNAVNEYFDYKSGADLYVAPEDRTNFSGGKKVIVDGILTCGEVRFTSYVAFTCAILFAIPVVLYRPDILYFGLTGAFLSIFYTAPPLKLSYRGLGELAVALTFGPLVVNGAYYLGTGNAALAPFLLSIPIAFLIANVLWVNEIPDVEADLKAEKMNLVARLGRKRAAIGFGILFALSFISIIVAVVILAEPLYLIGLLSAVLVPSAVKTAVIHHSNTQKLVGANRAAIRVYVLAGLMLSVAALIS